MTKAVLVIDMPESCDMCPLFCNHYSDMCCRGANDRGINYPYPNDFKQDWCPLVPMPEKKPFTGVDAIKSPFLDKRIDEAIHETASLAWNACLDQITR